MLEINKSQIGEITVLDIIGRIDAMNSSQLQHSIEQVIANRQDHDLLLRMANVNYLSAAGLRVLRMLKQATGDVRLVEPSNRVIEVMQITGLDAIYEMYPSLTDALHQTDPVVNAHTHLELGALKSGLPDILGQDFVPWIEQAIDEQLEQRSSAWESQWLSAIQDGIQELLTSGVTTVADISSTGLSIEPLLQARLRGTVYIEVLGAYPHQAEESFARLRKQIDTWRPRMRNGLTLGIAPHTPFSLSSELWEQVLTYAQEQDLPLCIHVAESPAEVQYLQNGTGALADHYTDRDYEPPQVSPIAYLEQLGALDLHPLLVHAVHVSDADIALIKQYDCTVVHCPRSNLRLRCGRMPLEKFIEADIPVLIGTDSLVSSPSLNIFDELEVAIGLHHGRVSPETLLKMVHRPLPTTNQ